MIAFATVLEFHVIFDIIVNVMKLSVLSCYNSFILDYCFYTVSGH